MKRRVWAAFLVIMLVFTIAPLQVSAAAKTTKPRTMFMDVTKSGNTVYCGTSAGLYVVNLKNGKASSVYVPVHSPESWKVITYMTKKGNYIYFAEQGEKAWNLCRIYRMNVTSGKKKLLSGKKLFSGYAIKGSRIYFGNLNDTGTLLKARYSCRLNGTGMKKVNIKIRTKIKKSNSKGYKILDKFVTGKNGDWNKYYLKTPKEKVYLGKQETL